MVVLLNRKLLVEIMQGKFSNDFSKTWERKKKKVIFYYPCLGGDICLGCSFSINDEMRTYPLGKTDLGQNGKRFPQLGIHLAWV